MKLQDALQLLPDTDGCVIILSGGLDSTIAMRLAVEKYGADNVHAISFFYGQKQSIELERAKKSTASLGVNHRVLNLDFLKEMAKGFSSNVDEDMQVPTIKEVLGHPQPTTYLPYRNMLMLTYATIFAEVNKVETIICGLQVSDLYGYWDTTPTFVKAMNDVISQNRMFKPEIIAPFNMLNKTEEIKLLKEMDGKLDLLKYTLTCYDPDKEGRSCGKCASCSERKKAFREVGEIDPIEYQ